MDCLVHEARVKVDREVTPRLLAVDSQSVKKVQFIVEETGIDGGKLINGRKRTLWVDKLGLPFAIKVTAANISDNQAGILAVEQIKVKVPTLKKIAADAGYKNAFKQHIETNFKCEVEIAQKPESAQGFIPPPKKTMAGRKELGMA